MGVVADAVMGACDDAVLTAVVDAGDELSGYSFPTGQPIPMGKAIWDNLRRKAVFYVVQARAGHCPVP